MMNVLFSGPGFEVYSAPVFAGLAGLTAFLCLRALRGYAGLSADELWELVLLLVLGVLGGAVSFYAVFYNGGLGENIRALAVSGRFAGGAFWGSFWAGLAATALYCLIKKKDLRRAADAVSLSAILALAVMRAGCFLHGCCFGSPTGLPWGVVYSDPRCAVPAGLLGVPLHPAQLYESAASLAIFAAAWLVRVRLGKLRPGGAFLIVTAAYSVLRLAVDLIRGGDPGILSAAGLSTAQILSLLSAAAAALAYLI